MEKIHKQHGVPNSIRLVPHHSSLAFTRPILQQLDYDGSFKLSVADNHQYILSRIVTSCLTLKVEQDIGLVVLEHLRDELDIHVLNVDLLAC